eukprot:TRINITY_DN33600_c0_g1_i1.p2 TRINITY_DN33600_c0_g1~~TRINITY_DN33600_c0_g1_i1.p2  ORF type:complete len:168 (+),score=10.51 TRINITY_DN33600_c0_g1_i1:152-655(+)
MGTGCVAMTCDWSGEVVTTAPGVTFLFCLLYCQKKMHHENMIDTQVIATDIHPKVSAAEVRSSVSLMEITVMAEMTISPMQLNSVTKNRCRVESCLLDPLIPYANTSTTVNTSTMIPSASSAGDWFSRSTLIANAMSEHESAYASLTLQTKIAMDFSLFGVPGRNSR